jgi:transcriptional regulator NrdR family protein
MECPDCGAASRVMETRPGAARSASPLSRALAAWIGGAMVFRRRCCTSCGLRWATGEVMLADLQGLQGRLQRLQRKR